MARNRLLQQIVRSFPSPFGTRFGSTRWGPLIHANQLFDRGEHHTFVRKKCYERSQRSAHSERHRSQLYQSPFRHLDPPRHHLRSIHATHNHPTWRPNPAGNACSSSAQEPPACRAPTASRSTPIDSTSPSSVSATLPLHSLCLGFSISPLLMDSLDAQGYCGGQAFSIPIDKEKYGSNWMNQGVQGGSYIYQYALRFWRTSTIWLIAWEDILSIISRNWGTRPDRESPQPRSVAYG